MISPVGRGGVGSNGGTTSPCGTSALLSGGSTTALTIHASQTLEFKANVHGPGPFSLLFAKDGVTFDTTILSGFKYTITAGSTSSDDMKLVFTVPSVTCTGCALQLKGMAATDGTQEWYNCANINIVAPPCSSICKSENGKCDKKTDVCDCKSGHAGFDCSFITAGNGDVYLTLTIASTTKNFDKDTFISTVAAQTGLPTADVKVKSVKGSKKHKNIITVEVQLVNDGSHPTVTAASAGQIIESRVASNQTVGTYATTAVTNDSKNHGKKGGVSPGGAAAASIIMLMLFFGSIGGLVWYWKKNPEKAPAKIREML